MLGSLLSNVDDGAPQIENSVWQALRAPMDVLNQSEQQREQLRERIKQVRHVTPSSKVALIMLRMLLDPNDWPSLAPSLTAMLLQLKEPLQLWQRDAAHGVLQELHAIKNHSEILDALFSLLSAGPSGRDARAAAEVLDAVSVILIVSYFWMRQSKSHKTSAIGTVCWVIGSLCRAIAAMLRLSWISRLTPLLTSPEMQRFFVVLVVAAHAVPTTLQMIGDSIGSKIGFLVQLILFVTAEIQGIIYGKPLPALIVHTIALCLTVLAALVWGLRMVDSEFRFVEVKMKPLEKTNMV